MTSKHIILPQLGEGIYLMRDVARILNLDYSHVRRWIIGYWANSLDDNYDYTFGYPGNKAINFYSLIEFYTFYKLREKGLSTMEIKKLHKELSEVYKTPYPFALAQEFFVDKRPRKFFVYYKYLDSIIKRGPKKQYSFNFIQDFLDRIEFDKDNMACRFYPLGMNSSIVVDPKHQFGQPVIRGTNIKTQSVYNLFKAGETNENICNLYNISLNEVRDAIMFHKSAA